MREKLVFMRSASVCLQLMMITMRSGGCFALLCSPIIVVVVIIIIFIVLGCLRSGANEDISLNDGGDGRRGG